MKSKTGAEMALILAERALMPTICLVNLVKLCATMTGISFIFTYGGTRKGENEVFSRSRWSTQDMTDLHHVEKKKSNSCLAPHIVLHFPLMHGCCHVAGQREGEGDRNRGRERQEHRMRSWGGGVAAVFGFHSSPSGKGCAESGLCASAQSQSGEGTRVLCVIINRQCISEPPPPHQISLNHTLQPTPP